ncbi:hypothetical protein Q4Q39_05670 [Flavivirga amylovorans]|uniref:Uncharacterized protein n=1 Tax=Flavivirga amylovorans TaxID=870486 RepID=A0ABT8WYY6_9FLAO|nr:hypothetical protein [Flavivirga amylovorans]MDO5986891.1 hypothetical protein [Flavivirga amylovorans]
MSKIYDYVFYSIYRNTSITNKSIPDWSTTIAISILLALNVFSILIYAEYDIESIGEKGFGAIPLVLVGINYLYFLRNDRYKNILNRFKNHRNKLISDSLVLTYACISVFILFYALRIELKTTLFVTGFIALTGIIPYLFRPKKE